MGKNEYISLIAIEVTVLGKGDYVAAFNRYVSGRVKRNLIGASYRQHESSIGDVMKYCALRIERVFSSAKQL